MIKKFKEFFKQNTGNFNIVSIQTHIDKEKSNSIKENMLSGDYNFSDKNNIIAYYFINDKYIISEGNHRMHAALSIWKESGDYSFVEKLIKNGLRYNIKNQPKYYKFNF